MSDDLLGHLIGPTPYSSWLSWLALALLLVLIAWYAAVFVVTAPRMRQRGLPMWRSAKEAMVRRRFARSVRAIGDGFRSGDLDAAGAAAAISGELRRFLHRVTGLRVEYMQVDDMANGELEPAATLLAQLGDVRFSEASRVDVGEVSRSVEELIRSWA